MELYKETVKLIRESDVDVILNITTGMGGDLVPSEENPAVGGPGTDMISAAERVAHIEKIKPEICSLDCGSFNYAATAYVATMDMLRESAVRIRRAGVKPELEVFELGHIWQAKQLIRMHSFNCAWEFPMVPRGPLPIWSPCIKRCRQV